MSHVEGGEKYYIRKEYAEINNLDKEENNDATLQGSRIPSIEPTDDNGGTE
jgi:hypothetical protein